MENIWQPTEEFLLKIDVHTLLPQQEPFVMIDYLIGFSETSTITKTTVSKDNIFTENGMFSASGLIENIAQTCAARIGYVNKYILKKGIQIGFIGAIRDFKIEKLPQVGQVIITRVDILEDVFGMTLAEASVECDEDTIVTTQIKIAIEKGDTE